jgi:homocysteine S-methyltransferase
VTALHRDPLPQLAGKPFLTDGGLETTLVFLDGRELPCFAAFPLLESAAGRRRLRDYFGSYIVTAKRHGAGFLLTSPTWRANADWGAKLGFGAAELAHINRNAIDLLGELREEHASAETPIVLDGIIGPRGDGYRSTQRMTEVEAERYHAAQVTSFREAGADMAEAQTLNYPEEAIGIARAARAVEMPVVISFTVETDGKLPSGDTLQSAITRVDDATEAAPAYYMINCAHPSHFGDALRTGAPWLQRLRGLRCNASRKSHAELDAATELDAGDPAEFGREYRRLRERLPRLSVLGGCCGTDDRHIAAIAAACFSA